MYREITQDYIYLFNPAPFGSEYSEKLPQEITLGGGLGYAYLGYRELAIGDSQEFIRDLHEYHSGSFREPMRSCIQRYKNDQLFVLWIRRPLDGCISALTGFLVMRYVADGTLKACDEGCVAGELDKPTLKAFSDELLEKFGAGKKLSDAVCQRYINVPANMDFRP